MWSIGGVLARQQQRPSGNAILAHGQLLLTGLIIFGMCVQCVLIDHPVTLGGPGREVEIDESKFMHLASYHRGF